MNKRISENCSKLCGLFSPKGGKFFEECLVKWKNLSVEDATWENAPELQDRFPDLNLKDKVPVKVGGIDKPRRSQRVSLPN